LILTDEVVTKKKAFSKEIEYARLAADLKTGPDIYNCYTLDWPNSVYSYGVIEMEKMSKSMKSRFIEHFDGDQCKRNPCGTASTPEPLSTNDITQLAEIIKKNWEKGFMHMDMHADNIMYTMGTDTTRIKLIDYGRVISRKTINEGCHTMNEFHDIQQAGSVHIKGPREALTESLAELVISAELYKVPTEFLDALKELSSGKFLERRTVEHPI
jgi:serine/threonine protein kinase